MSNAISNAMTNGIRHAIGHGMRHHIRNSLTAEATEAVTYVPSISDLSARVRPDHLTIDASRDMDGAYGGDHRCQ